MSDNEQAVEPVAETEQQSSLLKKSKPAVDTIMVVTKDEATSVYEHALIEYGSSGFRCIVLVDDEKLSDGYKMLEIEPYRETISFRNENNTIGYKTLTHRLVGKKLVFGATFSPDGTIELYLFLPKDKSVDCKFIAKTKVDSHVVDPMYAIVSEYGVSVVYNSPSEAARALTVSNRQPKRSEDTGIVFASGALNVVKFSLKDGKEAHRALPKMYDMESYACKLVSYENEPAIVLVNMYSGVTGQLEAERISLKSLVSSLFVDADDNTKHAFPLGVSLIIFENESEIIQMMATGESKWGIPSIAICESEQVGKNALTIMSADEYHKEIENHERE